MPVSADNELLGDLLAREDRPLLRAAPLAHLLDTGEVTDVFANPLAEQLFLAEVRRAELVHVHNARVPRATIDLGDVSRLGRVELS